MTSSTGWQFWIDRGGTFTDVVARSPDGQLAVHKLLSDNSERYADAALQGIRDVLGLPPDAALPAERIDSIRIGTTLGTNALLTRSGTRTLLAITRGFKDQLRIGYQNRPEIFALNIVLPRLLYEEVIEIDERMSAHGEELVPVNLSSARATLAQAYAKGIRAVAVAFIHGYRYSEHEKHVAELAQEIGFTQISASHEVAPLIRLVSRAETAVVDAYLSPLLKSYVSRIAQETQAETRTRLLFMQSNGGLAEARHFSGKDSILSGPAGGIVGAVQASRAAGFSKIISFDMGGTSTDVAHYEGEYERSFETEIAGVRLRTPMLKIHSVAAGGGSMLNFDGSKYRVGPGSAGADPGPACYRRGGPLTVTDCNVMLGRIQPEFFPKVFGPNGNEPLDTVIVKRRLGELCQEIAAATGDARGPEQVAEGFLAVAVENMANAIKKISVQRGIHLADYVLCCFGGAAGQHACRVADSLRMPRIFFHPLAGVLSAYGIGVAEQRLIQSSAVSLELDPAAMPQLAQIVDDLAQIAKDKMREQSARDAHIIPNLHLRYWGSDTTLPIAFSGCEAMRLAFLAEHQRRFGFSPETERVIVESASVEAVSGGQNVPMSWERNDPGAPTADAAPPLASTAPLFIENASRMAPIYLREALAPGARVSGPALIIETISTIVVEPGWEAEVTERHELLLERVTPLLQVFAIGTQADPVLLEVFNNRFMTIAEEMGFALQNAAYSVNIKERLDFSCAVFDAGGDLIANAPHIPVHLGSMSESVKSIVEHFALAPGNVYLMNSPYHGGTHLPDITVVTPVFDDVAKSVLFFTASRGHHADIGGVSPGSMPPCSTRIDEEGAWTEGMKIVSGGKFLEAPVRDWLLLNPYPARNPEQNIADFRAQIAANAKGAQELKKMVEEFTLPAVQAYMAHVKDNAEEAVRRVIGVLKSGEFRYRLDNGDAIVVAVDVDREARTAKIDFTGTSPQRSDNFNAPLAVTKAAVLYVFRTLVAEPIPLNAGCLRPLELIIPDGSMLNPRPPAAVVAGNVETSQYIVDALYGALGIVAASQGTMNNFTFGNERYQYYETLCGGAGAGVDFDGTDAVHTHMTNSRLTDPEVLEWRFPVRVESFEIRKRSGGRGAHRGGDGVIRKIRFLEPMNAAILSSHRVLPPFGMEGGESGAIGYNRVERADGSIETLCGTAQVAVNPGDLFVIETPGGGGFGAPLQVES
jgi:5-oxoprolinase (ATP-hydrolysing)